MLNEYIYVTQKLLGHFCIPGSTFNIIAWIPETSPTPCFGGEKGTLLSFLRLNNKGLKRRCCCVCCLGQLSLGSAREGFSTLQWKSIISTNYRLQVQVYEDIRLLQGANLLDLGCLTPSVVSYHGQLVCCWEQRWCCSVVGSSQFNHTDIALKSTTVAIHSSKSQVIQWNRLCLNGLNPSLVIQFSNPLVHVTSYPAIVNQ